MNSATYFKGRENELNELGKIYESSEPSGLLKSVMGQI